MRHRKEQSLYPLVKKFLEEEIGCFKVGTRMGSRDLGQVDVIGIKSRGKELTNDFEVIVVEVKTDLKRFGIKIGQTLGYSIFANRCYLAVDKSFDNTFTEENKNFATQLRVGLIEVGKSKCNEVLSAPILNPSEYQKRFILEKLGLVCCTLCKNYTDKLGYSKKSHKSIQEKKPYFLHGTKDEPGSGKLFLCSDCNLSLSEIRGDSLINQNSSILENKIKDKKVRNKLSTLQKELNKLDLKPVPRKTHLCYNLNGKSFIEIVLKQKNFIIKILTNKRKIKGKGMLQRNRGSKRIIVNRDTDIGKVVRIIKSAKKRELS